MYYKQVKAYIENFDDVQIFLFEDLKNNTKKVVSALLDFLDVPILDNIKTEKIYNISGKPKINFLRKIMLENFFLKNAIKSIMPKSVKIFINDKINMFNLEQIPMKQDTRLDLIDFYKEDIKKLEKLLSKNLSNWKV